MPDPRVYKNAFIIEAHTLSKAVPNQWAAFLNAFRNYVSNEFENAISAAPDVALVAHGRAQALRALRDDFQDLERLFQQVTRPQQSR